MSNNTLPNSLCLLLLKDAQDVCSCSTHLFDISYLLGTLECILSSVHVSGTWLKTSYMCKILIDIKNNIWCNYKVDHEGHHRTLGGPLKHRVRERDLWTLCQILPIMGWYFLKVFYCSLEKENISNSMILTYRWKHVRMGVCFSMHI